MSKFKPEGLQCPVMAHFGERDSLKGFSSPADVEVCLKYSVNLYMYIHANT